MSTADARLAADLYGGSFRSGHFAVLLHPASAAELIVTPGR
jgi:hypothetical protein